MLSARNSAAVFLSWVVTGVEEMRQDRRRRYESPRRREQAEATRAEIAAAARRLFLTHGWARTSVRDVAREAGVAEPTVYAAYEASNDGGRTR